MRRIARTSAVLFAAMACLSFSAAAASAVSTATVHPSSHALQTNSRVAAEAAPLASATGAVRGLRVGAAPDAYGDIECSGDVCIQSTCAHCLDQPINVRANRTTFTGHFEVTFGCTIGGCTVFNSPNRSWPAGGTHWTSPAVPSAANTANVYGWKGGPPWTQIGDVGFYLDL
jgi:hypothetical protein